MRHPARAFALALLPPVVAAVAACGRAHAASSADAQRPDSANAADGVAAGVGASGARFVVNVLGFQGPESVRYDSADDVFFVSNMTGYGSKHDGNGYITRVSAADPNVATVFIQGGRNGAVLDSPKGLALHGDTLWVADIAALRGFDRHTGAPLATIDLAPLGAVLLNDVAVGPDGSLRVTDTGIEMGEVGVVHTGPDRIFTVGPARAVSVMAAGPALRQPNGITWDASAQRWIVVSFDPFVGEIATFGARDSVRHVLHRAPVGRLDGVEVLPGGGILYTSWADSSVHLLAGGRDRQIVREVPEPADIGIDTRRHRLAIPLSTLGRVQLWDIHALDRTTP